MIVQPAFVFSRGALTWRVAPFRFWKNALTTFAMRRRKRRVFLCPFEQRVIKQVLFQFVFEFDRRQLQQSDRLLQLRGQRKMLRKPELEGWFHARNRVSHRIGKGVARLVLELWLKGVGFRGENSHPSTPFEHFHYK